MSEDMNTLHTAAPTPTAHAHPQLDAAQRAQIAAILRQFGIAHAALFGSFARGDGVDLRVVFLLVLRA